MRIFLWWVLWGKSEMYIIEEITNTSIFILLESRIRTRRRFVILSPYCMQFLGPPDVTFTLSERSDSVVLEAITPGYGWDYFDVGAVPSLARSYINQTSLTLPLEITELTRGTQYTLTVSVYFRSSCGTQQQQSSVTETICTGDQMSISVLTSGRME